MVRVGQEAGVAQRRPWEVEDSLWELIEPLLPRPERRFRHPGRRRLDDRKALCGILFVLYTGIPWEFLPQELGYGSGMTCWRRLRDWQAGGGWGRARAAAGRAGGGGVAAAARGAAGPAQRVRGDRLVPGGGRRVARAGAKRGAKTGPSPVDRARAGSKHHVITDAGGIPLAVTLTGGNRHDVTQLIPPIGAIPPVRGGHGR